MKSNAANEPHGSAAEDRRGEQRSQDATRPFTLGRAALFLLLAIGGCAADLATKHWAFEWRGLPRGGNEWWLWEGYVGIETALNPGALFGMGAGGGLVFAVLSIVASIAILIGYFGWNLGKSLWLTVALGIILGGILGNLYDRLGMAYTPAIAEYSRQVAPDHDPEYYRRAVRDWILFRYGRHTWPNFNIADSLLVCGAAMLMLHAWRQESGERTVASNS